MNSALKNFPWQLNIFTSLIMRDFNVVYELCIL